MFMLALLVQGFEISDDPYPVHSVKAVQIAAAVRTEFQSGWSSKGLEERLDRALLQAGVKPDNHNSVEDKQFEEIGDPVIVKTLGDPGGLFISVWFRSHTDSYWGEVVLLLCHRVKGKTRVEVVSDSDNNGWALVQAEAYAHGSKLTVGGLYENVKLRKYEDVASFGLVHGRWRQLHGSFSGPNSPDRSGAPWEDTTAFAPRFVRRSGRVVGNEVEMHFKVQGKLDHLQRAPTNRINQIWKVTGGAIREIRSWTLDTPYHALSELKHFRDTGDRASFNRGVRPELAGKLWRVLKFNWNATVPDDPGGNEERQQWATQFELTSWTAVPMDSHFARLERRHGRWIVVGFS